MFDRSDLRETTSEDLRYVLDLLRRAFPDEDLTPLVSTLLQGSAPVFSLGFFEDTALIAHCLFTICDTQGHSERCALLGPLAVLPERQRSGIGTTLVRSGMESLTTKGIRQVFVLGDPVYYARFGFLPEQRILPPYALPEAWDAAWQSVCLNACPPADPARLVLPEAWMDPALWRP